MTPTAFHFKRRVEFSDTDAAGIVHFTSLLQYVEQAEHALFRNLGSSILVPIAEGDSTGAVISWPRVKISVDFHGSARFEQELDVFLAVERLGTKSVTYSFRISRNGQPICSGTSTSVCCQIDHRQSIQSIEIPPKLKEQLRAYLTVS
jgi:acyl-CoA thioester hydrolase